MTLIETLRDMKYYGESKSHPLVSENNILRVSYCHAVAVIACVDEHVSQHKTEYLKGLLRALEIPAEDYDRIIDKVPSLTKKELEDILAEISTIRQKYAFALDLHGISKSDKDMNEHSAMLEDEAITILLDKLDFEEWERSMISDASSQWVSGDKARLLSYLPFIGRYFRFGCLYNTPILWRCASADNEKFQLLSEYIIDFGNSDIIGLVKWLNSKERETKNNRSLGSGFLRKDNCGFLSGFTKEEISKILPVVLSGTKEKSNVYILSTEEVVKIPFKLGKSVTDEAAKVNSSMKIKAGNAYSYCLRPDDGIKQINKLVDSKGKIIANKLKNFGIAPAINLRNDGSGLMLSGGDGSISNPYIIA